MTNQSIKAAFERFWQHVLAKINEVMSTKSSVEMITWEEDD